MNTVPKPQHGRHAGRDAPRRTQLAMYVTEDEAEATHRLATAMGMSTSELLRESLLDALTEMAARLGVGELHDA